MFRKIFSYFSKTKKSALELEVEESLLSLDTYTRKILNVGYFNPYDLSSIGGVRFDCYFNNIEAYIDFLTLVLKYHDEVRNYSRYKNQAMMITFFKNKQQESFRKPRDELIKLVMLYKDFKELMIRLDTGVGCDINTSFLRCAMPIVLDLENIFNTILRYK